jgi:putative membrane protein insertion efficiency factor
MTWARRVVIFPIALYRSFLAPLIAPRCKYEPSCSNYAIQAISEFGILRGVVLAGWRVMRCNPWSHGGYDPVGHQRLFGARAATHRAP